MFGGSWGSTLALAYAETHPERATGLVLRGIFLGRKLEIDWTFVDGLRRMEPEGWDAFVAGLTPRERGAIVRAYYRKLTSDDALVRREAALAWNKFENHASKLVPVEEPVAEEDVPKEIALARIEAHYFLNGSFLKSDDQLLHDAERLRRIPGVIVQGKYDLVCPLQSAWDLHLAWPEAQYVVVPDAGHSADEPGITSALVAATEDFKKKV